MEGKIFSRVNRAKRGMTHVQWLTRLVKYWILHSTPQVPLLHWTHKTEAEKRAERNRKARERRAKAKAKKKK